MLKMFQVKYLGLNEVCVLCYVAFICTLTCS